MHRVSRATCGVSGWQGRQWMGFLAVDEARDVGIGDNGCGEAVEGQEYHW